MHVSNLERRPCVAGLRPQRELGATRDNYGVGMVWPVAILAVAGYMIALSLHSSLSHGVSLSSVLSLYRPGYCQPQVLSPVSKSPASSS